MMMFRPGRVSFKDETTPETLRSIEPPLQQCPLSGGGVGSNRYFDWSLHFWPSEGYYQHVAAIGEPAEAMEIDAKVTYAEKKSDRPCDVWLGAINDDGRVEGAKQFRLYSKPVGANFRMLVTNDGITLKECDGDSDCIQGKGLRPWLMIQNDDSDATLEFRCLNKERVSTPDAKAESDSESDSDSESAKRAKRAKRVKRAEE